MGNQFCCNEDRNTEPPSNAEENDNNNINKEIDENINNQNNRNNINNGDNLPTLQDNNTIDSEKKNQRKIKKYDTNNLEDIDNMKSSIFDNENENDNFYSNDENKESTANFRGMPKKKVQSGNNSSENCNVKISIKKKKKDLNILDNEVSDIKNVIKNNPNYKNKPLKLKNFNDNKENEFYLINNPKYIGLKNANSNLVFVKNKIKNLGFSDNIELKKTKKEFIKDKRDLKNMQKNNKINKEEEINTKDRIVYTNYSYSKQDSESISPNIEITTKNHNIPFEDNNMTDNNYSSTSRRERKIKNFNYINKDSIKDKIHSSNQRLIEIYARNQIRKIIKFLSNKTKKSEKPKQILDIDKIKKIINNNNKLSKDEFEEEDYNNNMFIQLNNLKNNNNNEINDISSSFEVLNTSKSQTILNKNKNFCIKYFSNGSIYIGEVKQDKLYGHGKFMNIQGDIILGFFKDNCFHGYNYIERNQNNSKFEGQFEKNKFNGYGIEQFSDGSSYFGQYKNNEKWGLGTYSWGNGCQYQGEWRNGRPNGMGIFVDNKNRYYEGEWKNGKMNGIGLFKWGDGRKYFGEFNNDKRNGFGIYFWNNPLKIYVGFWINGMQDGIGKVLTSFKVKYCLWNNGKITNKYTTKNDIALQIDKKERNKMKKYQYFFKLTTDDMLTYILDL